MWYFRIISMWYFRIISIIVGGGIEMACGKVRITFNQMQCYICIL